MKIALTIPTGRPRIKRVVKAFLDNASSYGYNPKDFSLYLSIDPSFRKTKVTDYRLEEKLAGQLGKVDYISPADRKKLAEKIASETRSDPVVINDIFGGRGYSKLRNSALFHALQDGNDISICIDDDEAPFIPVEEESGDISWNSFDFFGPHILTLNSEADITRGPYIGYLSPIPSDFDRDIPEKIKRRLGEALKPGSDVIDEDSFFNLMNKIRYLPYSEVDHPTRPFTAKETGLGKHIFSGNMGINLDSVRSGRVPVFYTPPLARGEDTIFSLQLGKLEVVEVPSYIFHDPFELYPGVLKGEFPKRLKGIPVTKKSKERFTNALIGWLKYAPILIHMTSKNPEDREERIREMLKKIKDPTEKLADILNCPRLTSCKKVLQDYSENAPDHYDSLMRAQAVWKQRIIPAYFSSAVRV